MKILLRILGGLAALVLLLVVVAFFLPGAYRVERSMAINARAETVFPILGDLRRWKEWGAWQERDPGMKVTYGGAASGVGAWSAWESKTEGNGRMTITVFQPPKRIEYRLEFPDMSMESKGSLEIVPAGAGVKVVWVDAGDTGSNPLFRWFGLFLDGMIGPDFERGLTRMKQLAEAAPK